MVSRWFFWTFATLYALAALVYFASALSPEGSDPLSGIYLIPLGLPWLLVIDAVRGGDGQGGAWLVILSPAINLGLLSLVARRFRR